MALKVNKVGKTVKLSELLSESQIQAQICHWLTLKNIFHWRANTGAAKYGDAYVRFGKKGCADIIGIVAKEIGGRMAPNPVGRFLAIEVKAAKGKLSIHQEAFRDAVKLNGGLFIVARSVEDVINAIDGKPNDAKA